MRSFWSRVPMLRLVFAFIAGVGLQLTCSHVLGYRTTLILIAAILLCMSLLFILSTAAVKKPTISFKLRPYIGIALQSSLITIAYLLAFFYEEKNNAHHFSNFLSEQNVLVVYINDPPVVRDKAVLATADVTEVNNMNGHIKTSGKIQISFLRDSICEHIQYGDVLLIRSKIDTTEGPKNPGEFDFKAYQAHHCIYHKTFLTRSDYRSISKGQGNLFLTAVYRLRERFLKTLARYTTDKNDFGVASAIMLGYRDFINADIMRAYASSGTVHILSVSGFHVSIMFFMLNFLLQWMDKRGNKMAFAKAGLIILFIWFYACLTGLSPPVLRCACMFTLIQVGTLFIRHINMYNIVTASALLLIIYYPYVITDVGFQLSYIAVFGLIYLQPKIANLLVLKVSEGNIYRVLDFFWQLTAASIAAQIATLPLCLFYFYQFPNLFLLSNLVVIPLSNLLLYSGTILFAVAHIPGINDIAGFVFNHILHGLNQFIFLIDELPFALTKGISISITEMILLYLIIALFCWLTEVRKNKVLLASLSLILLLSSFRSFTTLENARQKQLVVYAVSKQKAIAFISGQTLYYDFDSTLYNDASNMQFKILHHWWQCGIKQQISLGNPGPFSAPGIYTARIPQGTLVLFEDKKILIADSLSSVGSTGIYPPFKPDLVIISGTLNITLPALHKSIAFDQVIFDSRCRPASRKRWKKDCSELDIDYWDVNTQGAFIWNLKKP